MRRQYILPFFLIIIIIYYCASIIADHSTDLNKEVMVETKLNEVMEKREEHPGSLVYITGAVERPGLYEMGHPVPLEKIINAAGGLLPYADTVNMNMAEEIPNGTHIHINFNFLGNAEELLRKNLININTANEDELAKLKGVGPAIAKRIISYREEHGYFSKIDDIKKVKGIGNAFYNKIKDQITTE